MRRTMTVHATATTTAKPRRKKSTMKGLRTSGGSMNRADRFLAHWTARNQAQGLSTGPARDRVSKKTQLVENIEKTLNGKTQQKQRKGKAKFARGKRSRPKLSLRPLPWAGGSQSV